MEKKRVTAAGRKPQAVKKQASRSRKPAKKKRYLPTAVIGAVLVAFVAWRAAMLLAGSGNGKEAETSRVAPPSRSSSPGPAVRKEHEKPAIKDEGRSIVPKREEKKAEPEPPPARTGKPAAAPVREPDPSKPDAGRPPAAEPSRAGMCSIVIDDVGTNMQLLEEAISLLPRSVTFAVIPFQPYSRESAEKLRREGFEVILHSPMEAEEQGLRYNTANVLRSGMSAAEAARILELQLEGVPGAKGLNNHTGSKATKDPELMRNVMRFLRKKGLFFLDSRTTPLTAAYRLAREEGVPAAERKVFLDDDNSPSSIQMKIDEFVLLGQKEGKAVAIGHLRANTIRALSERVPYWQKRGSSFVPLSDIIKGDGTER